MDVSPPPQIQRSKTSPSVVKAETPVTNPPTLATPLPLHRNLSLPAAALSPQNVSTPAPSEEESRLSSLKMHRPPKSRWEAAKQSRHLSRKELYALKMGVEEKHFYRMNKKIVLFYPIKNEFGIEEAINDRLESHITQEYTRIPLGTIPDEEDNSRIYG